MKPMSYFIPLTIILFISSLSITTTQTLINSTCFNLSQTNPNIEYEFCKTSLQASPATQRTTLRALGIITIDLVRHNITDTICYTKRLSMQNKWDEQCLRDCLDLFTDAMSDAEDAMRFYDVMNFDDANVRISSIMDASTTCEDGFKEREGLVSPLTKRNDDVFQLSAIALSVMHMIRNGSG